jgi:porphobilinogen deaminase
MSPPLLRIGARGSKLSLAQTGQTRAALAALLEVEPERLEIVVITTSGDMIQDRRLIEVGGKGLFTKELDEAMADHRIDIAIHSLKDLPTRLPDNIALACVPAREDPRDAFVSARATSLVDPREAPPAACQGALAITARGDDARARDMLAAFENSDARCEIEAERAFLLALDGSCRTPIAALARRDGAALSFIGEALTPDGTARWRRTQSITLGANACADARALGERLGQDIRAEAGDALVLDS